MKIVDLHSDTATRPTPGNLVATLSHCQGSDRMIVDQMARIYRWEAGGAAVLGSVQPQPVAHQPDGTLALPDIEAAYALERHIERLKDDHALTERLAQGVQGIPGLSVVDAADINQPIVALREHFGS